MTRGRGRPRTWTEDRDAAVAEMCRAGHRVSEIASTLGVTVRAIRRRIDRLRTSGVLPRAIRPWTGAEVRRLSDMAASGMADDAIAAALGRTKGAVIDMRQRSGIQRADYAPRWSDDERAVVAEMARRGHTSTEIGAHIGRSRTAVRVEMWKMRRRQVGGR